MIAAPTRSSSETELASATPSGSLRMVSMGRQTCCKGISCCTRERWCGRLSYVDDLVPPLEELVSLIGQVIHQFQLSSAVRLVDVGFVKRAHVQAVVLAQLVPV